MPRRRGLWLSGGPNAADGNRWTTHTRRLSVIQDASIRSCTHPHSHFKQVAEASCATGAFKQFSAVIENPKHVSHSPRDTDPGLMIVSCIRSPLHYPLGTEGDVERVPKGLTKVPDLSLSPSSTDGGEQAPTGRKVTTQRTPITPKRRTLFRTGARSHTPTATTTHTP